MFEWKDLAIVFGGLWLSLLSWVGVREVKRIDAKAEKSDVEALRDAVAAMTARMEDSNRALLDRVENGQRSLEARIERSIEDARAGRKAIYDKIDIYAARQEELNREFSRLSGSTR